MVFGQCTVHVFCFLLIFSGAVLMASIQKVIGSDPDRTTAKFLVTGISAFPAKIFAVERRGTFHKLGFMVIQLRKLLFQ